MCGGNAGNEAGCGVDVAHRAAGGGGGLDGGAAPRGAGDLPRESRGALGCRGSGRLGGSGTPCRGTAPLRRQLPGGSVGWEGGGAGVGAAGGDLGRVSVSRAVPPRTGLMPASCPDCLVPPPVPAALPNAQIRRLSFSSRSFFFYFFPERRLSSEVVPPQPPSRRFPPLPPPPPALHVLSPRQPELLPANATSPSSCSPWLISGSSTRHLPQLLLGSGQGEVSLVICCLGGDHLSPSPMLLCPPLPWGSSKGGDPTVTAFQPDPIYCLLQKAVDFSNGQLLSCGGADGQPPGIRGPQPQQPLGCYLLFEALHAQHIAIISENGVVMHCWQVSVLLLAAPSQLVSEFCFCLELAAWTSHWKDGNFL